MAVALTGSCDAQTASGTNRGDHQCHRPGTVVPDCASPGIIRWEVSMARYITILKGKQGERKALGDLTPSIRSQVLPLIEIPPIPLKWIDGDDEPVIAKDIETHVAGQAAGISDAWGTDEPILLDGAFVEDEATLADGSEPIERVFDDARDLGLRATPVTGIGRTKEYVEAVARIAKKDKRGVALRLLRADFADLKTLESRLNVHLNAIGVAPKDIVLITDLGPIGAHEESALQVAIPAFIYAIPRIGEWKQFFLAGSAFPANLAGHAADTVVRIDRAEWMLWTFLHSRRSTVARFPDFGDYAVAHPDIAELDPRLMRMSPNIRYTTELQWLVAKGHAISRKKDAKKGKPMKDQYPELCKKIMKDPCWSGPAFSAGDKYIEQCSIKKVGSGNATTWRAVGTCHHIVFAVRQVARVLEL